MKCKLCGNDTDLIHDKQYDIDYFKCTFCDLIQMDQHKEITFEEERTVYDLHENTIENDGYVDYFKVFLNKAVLPFKSTGLLLDYGSGPEPVLSQIIERDYDFTTEIYDLHYQPEKNYLDSKYDVIVSTEVIEHVNNPLAFMKHLVAHMKDDGIIAIMTLFHHNDQEHFVKWWYRRDKTHITFFTPHTMEVLAKKCGLTILYCDQKRVITFGKFNELL